MGTGKRSLKRGGRQPRERVTGQTNEQEKMNEQLENAITLQPLSVGMMLQGLLTSVQRGETTPQTVEVLKGMMDLYERNEQRQSERDFAAALTELQGETIRVNATKAVDVKNGVPRYTFAPYSEIMAVVQPMLTKHGFSVTFDTKIDEQRLYSVCTLTHKGGFSRSNQFAVRFSKPPGSSEAQGDMSTKSYAKRGALCDALNITIDHDDDARMSGKPIGQALAEDLKARAKACGADEAKLLAFAGAAHYEAIPNDRYDDVDRALRRKEGLRYKRQGEGGAEPKDEKGYLF